MSDWLIAFDDGLVERLRLCTLCGSAPAHRWAIWEGTTHKAAYVLCVRCYAADRQRRRLTAMMQQRYGEGGMEEAEGEAC